MKETKFYLKPIKFLTFEKLDMNQNTNNKVLFEFIKESKSKKPAILLTSLVCGFIFSLSMFVFIVLPELDELTQVTFWKKVLKTLLGWLVFSGFIYIFLKFLVNRYTRNQPQDFNNTVPESTGNVLSKIPCSLSHYRLQIGGLMFIGETGVSFLPHKYNGKYSNICVDFLWNEVDSIYRSSGSWSWKFWRFSQLYDRLAIESNDKLHLFLVTDSLDQVIEKLNTLLESKYSTSH